MRTTARALTEMFNDAWDSMYHGFDQVIVDEVMHAADKLATLSYEIGPSKTPDGIEIEDDPIIAWIPFGHDAHEARMRECRLFLQQSLDC